MSERRRVAVMTGSRADYGLLRPVMRAIAGHPSLELAVVAAGAHLIAPADTLRDVRADFDVADVVPMQVAGRTGHAEDAEAIGRGVGRFTRVFERLDPAWVVVLGDRIEALAAATAASVGRRALAHVHAGDRAEGVADEAIRRAVSCLAHLHFAATPLSAERLVRMGERADRVHTVGSPAIDELDAAPDLTDREWAGLGAPDTLLLVHPIGRSDTDEERAAVEVFESVCERRVLWLHPNHDPGRAGIVRAIEGSRAISREHLGRDVFVGVLRRLSAGGVMVGNSSAGLIEASAMALPAVNVGPRQGGREGGSNVVHVEREDRSDIRAGVELALSMNRSRVTHPFGDGRTGERIARVLAETDPRAEGMRRKRCTY